MAYLDSTTNTGTSTTPATAVPTGVQADDIVILVASTDTPGAVFETTDFPSGFTRLFDSNCTADNQSMGIGWKRLTGADSGSYTFATVGFSGEWICQAVAFRGRHTTDPPEATEAVQNTAQSPPVTITATGVTAVGGDDLCWISCPDVKAAGAGNGHTAPTDFTIREDAENSWTNLAIATRDDVSAGATGNISGTLAMTSSTAGYVAYLVRIPSAIVATGQPTSRRVGGVLHGIGASPLGNRRW